MFIKRKEGIWKKAHQERGVSFLEFSILAPVLLVIFTALFQFASILTDKAILSEALRSTARYTASLNADCGNRGFEHFTDTLKKSNNDHRLNNFKLSFYEFSYTDDDITSLRVPAMKLEASLGLSCSACELILGKGNSLINVSSSVTLPLESPLSCENLEEESFEYQPIPS